jgi:predicted DNA-binding WGR domain protein
MKAYLLPLALIAHSINLIAQSSGVEISCPPDIIVCVTSDGFGLEGGDPPGGEYTGIGVIGNTFIPDLAGIGRKQIYYFVNQDSCDFYITVKGIVTTLPAISGPKHVCKSSTFNYQTEPIENADTYIWTYQADTFMTDVPNIDLFIKDSYHSGQLKVYGSNGACADGAPATYAITVHDLPQSQITGAETTCKNASWVQYATLSDNSPFKYAWEVVNGTIIASCDTSIFVHWGKTGNSGQVKLKRYLAETAGCETEFSKTVQFTQNVAPDSEEIIVKNNNLATRMLVCPSCTVNGYDHYQWGYEKKTDRIEIPVSACDDQHYCEFPQSLDTAVYYYWLRIIQNNGCITKCYFNIGDLLHVAEPSTIDVAVFPNPFSDYLILQPGNHAHGTLKIAIHSAMGLCVYEGELKLYDNRQNFIPTETLSNGVFILSLMNDSGTRVVRKLIKYE